MSGSSAISGSAAEASKLGWRDRLLIIGGFLLTTGITSWVGFVAQDRASECQTVRAQRLSDVERFRGAAAKFEPLIGPYMGAAMQGKDTIAVKKALTSNLHDQRSALPYLRSHLDAQGRETADRLDKAIVSFILETDKNPTGVDVGPAYQELEYIFENSEDLVAATNRATGMDSSKFTIWRFWGDC